MSYGASSGRTRRPRTQTQVTDAGAAFTEAIAGLFDVAVREEVILDEAAAPRRLAPHATAVSARIPLPGDPDEDLASGQLIVLFDPDGQEGWPGRYRVVVYVHADLELEIAADPLLGPVGWSWLTDALDGRNAGYRAPSGTVTRSISESFGGKSDDERVITFELRASWSPADDDPAAELPRHVGAFTDVVCAAAGLPPAGVSNLRPSRS